MPGLVQHTSFPAVRPTASTPTITGAVAYPSNGKVIQVEPGAAPVHAVHCFGVRPSSNASVFPLTLQGFNTTHSARTSVAASLAEDATHAFASAMPVITDEASNELASEVWQLALKSSANQSSAPPTQAELDLIVVDENYQRLVPITPGNLTVLYGRRCTFIYHNMSYLMLRCLIWAAGRMRGRGNISNEFICHDASS